MTRINVPVRSNPAVDIVVIVSISIVSILKLLGINYGIDVANPCLLQLLQIPHVLNWRATYLSPQMREYLLGDHVWIGWIAQVWVVYLVQYSL